MRNLNISRVRLYRDGSSAVLAVLALPILLCPSFGLGLGGPTSPTRRASARAHATLEHPCGPIAHALIVVRPHFLLAVRGIATLPCAHIGYSRLRTQRAERT
ncbi:hypothetical protein K438DRAFT_1962081 [Mycena galopus ATCC 62051]|nr:hypothetical protein K438DRAFT_1962081 [Mycena galopus ATCC 62051]